MRLLAWMEDDPYGFCYGLEEDAARAFTVAIAIRAGSAVIFVWTLGTRRESQAGERASVEVAIPH